MGNSQGSCKNYYFFLPYLCSPCGGAFLVIEIDASPEAKILKLDDKTELINFTWERRRT